MPLPIERRSPTISDGSLEAVLATASLACCAVQPGWAPRTRATMPAVCGDDIEVPEAVSEPNPVPLAADTSDTPGAITSGLAPASPLRGPLEVNDAGVL